MRRINETPENIYYVNNTSQSTKIMVIITVQLITEFPKDTTEILLAKSSSRDRRVRTMELLM